MRSIRRALRLIVATGALLPLLASAPAEASIEDCGWYTDFAHPTYVRISENGLNSTVMACVGVVAVGSWTMVGVFLTPSGTQLTTDGTEHTVRLGGGVCVSVLAPVQGSECLHDPSLSVAAGQYDSGSSTGKVTYGQVVPCIDDTTPSGYPSLFGYGVGMACVDVGFSADVGTDPYVRVVPGLCVNLRDTYVCVHVDVWATGGSVDVSVCRRAPTVSDCSPIPPDPETTP